MFPAQKNENSKLCNTRGKALKEGCNIITEFYELGKL
jgi:hypothetical protein